MNNSFKRLIIEGERIKEVGVYQQGQRTDAAFWGVYKVS